MEQLGMNNSEGTGRLMGLIKDLNHPDSVGLCESILCVPQLCSDFPFPAIVTTIFLKLADLFRTQNNFVRELICRVTDQSAFCLIKLTSIDEIVHRFFVVSHSNDPSARALTVRLLGGFAAAMPERKDAHHLIVKSLLSHNQVEVETSVWAAQQFASISPSFCHSAVDNVETVLQSLATPAALKIKLILLLKHIHHDEALAVRARSICVNLLETFKGVEFVPTLLHTLTNIVVSTLFAVRDHLDLLFTFLQTDWRRKIKIHALVDLRKLAEHAPHAWASHHISLLCAAVVNSPPDIQERILLVLQSIVQCNVNIDEDEETKLLECCGGASCSTDPRVAIRACLLQMTMCSTCDTSKLDRLLTSTGVVGSLCYVTAHLLSTAEDSPKRIAAHCKLLKSVLDAMEKECLALIDVESIGILFDNLVSSIETNFTQYAEKFAVMVLKALQIVVKHSPNVSTDEAANLLLRIATDCHSKAVVIPIYKVLLTLFPRHSEHLSNLGKSIINTEVEGFSVWDIYVLGQVASGIGAHSVAAELYDYTSERVVSDHYYYWMSGLTQLSSAEALLISSLVHKNKHKHGWEEPIQRFHAALISFKAAAQPIHTIRRQTQLIGLRIRLLEGFHLLVCGLRQVNSSSAVSTSGDALTSVIQIFTGIAESASIFLRELLDAGEELQQMASIIENLSLVVATAISQCLCPNKAHPGAKPAANISESQNSRGVNQNLHKVVTAIQEFSQTANKESSSLSLRIRMLLRHITNVALVPMCYPRAFFYGDEGTTLQFSVTSEKAGRTVSTRSMSQLVVTIDGVVRRKVAGGRKAALKLVSVELSIVSKLSNKGGMEMPVTFETGEAVPLSPEGFFNTACVLDIPEVSVISTLEVVVSGAVRDERGIRWNVKGSSGMHVKVARSKRP